MSDVSTEPVLHVTFVCSGNICRSPMAEKMFAHQISERGLADVVRVSSGGTGGWHAGDGADARACLVLRERGYPSDHVAAQVSDDHLGADLVVALGRNHLRILSDLGVPDERLRMLRSFDPRSGAHARGCGGPLLRRQDRFRGCLHRDRSVPAGAAQLGRSGSSTARGIVA